MKKCLRNALVAGMTGMMVLGGSMTSFAGILMGEVGPAAVTYDWDYDEIGWRVKGSDGSYMISRWYQSPASGLWYYMGADGYMVTNTVTPDGYYVNADGVWVEEQPQIQPEAAPAETAAQSSNARVAGVYQTVSISPEAAEPELEPVFKGTVTIGVDTSNGFAMTFNNMPTKITEIYANEESLDDDFDCPDPYLVWFDIVGREYCYGVVQADGTMDANFGGIHVFYKKVN